MSVQRDIVEDMKLSIVISTCNRTKLFGYSIRSIVYQTFPRPDMEIVVVDDGSTEDTLGVLKHYKPFLGCKIKYIKIDSSKYERIKIERHTPALTNNIGFRNSEGDVILIQGNDILHVGKDNFKYGYERAMNDESVFAEVWQCDKSFINYLDTNQDWKNLSNLMSLYNEPGAKDTYNTSAGWYWYILFLRKYFVDKVRGVDEEYLKGVCAEDDDFAIRIARAGTNHIRDNRIKAIHLWHFDEDAPNRKRWGNKFWEEGARINRSRFYDLQKSNRYLANETIDWGSESVVIQKEIL